MALLTLTQVARATGKAKSTVHRTIESGRLSVAMRDDLNRPLFEPGEVQRVWPTADLAAFLVTNGTAERTDGTDGTDATRQIAKLTAELAREANLREKAEQELKQQLDRWQTEREGLNAERQRLSQTLQEQLPQLLSGLLAQQAEQIDYRVRSALAANTAPLLISDQRAEQTAEQTEQKEQMHWLGFWRRLFG